MDDPAIAPEEIIESCVNLNLKDCNDDETIFDERKATCKTQSFYILLAFLLNTIALLIAVSIYCYLIKYQAKQNIYYNLTLQITN